MLLPEMEERLLRVQELGAALVEGEEISVCSLSVFLHFFFKISMDLLRIW